MGRGRPGGNPEFGTKFKFDYGNEEKRDVALTIRITATELDRLKRVAGEGYRDFCRDAIAQAVEQHKAAQLTKTETTEPGQADQPQQHSQTNQEGQTLETNPTLAEQGATPRKQRKAGQSQGQKQAKPRSQTRSRRSTATEKTTEQDQPDKD
ncbi:hypothetical protein [Nostoc sp. PA-18-2419]|uniref:hypothetical protein n=1 Tax=Nostoc sp. PA-18-2419 TaxID=2575443 RepID=UPI00110925BE|nr:hypothetical protein [Nostoc sp. PA-18-2419]